MKFIVFTGILAFLAVPLFSQTNEMSIASDHDQVDSLSSISVDPVNSRLPIQNTNKKLNVNVNMGTSVAVSHGNFYSSYYVAPAFNYQVNPRLNVRVGVVYMNATIPPISISENQSYSYPAVNNISVFTEGRYSVNPRLTLSGSAYKQVNTNTQSMNPKALDYGMQGVSVGFDYKLSEGIHVGAQINFQNNTNPYYNPYYRYSPYGMYPMNTGVGTGGW